MGFVVYEIDTWPWLTGVASRLGRTVTLADVPAEVWDEAVPSGVDAVWLMGVWERSPAGVEVALANQQLGRAFRAALPDLRPEDVVGSPYCVRRYRVDERLGGPAALAVARAELARRGARLILDYVPNHVAPDHPAVTEDPERFILGDAGDLARDPGAWMAAGDHVIARGRDPYFPPWPDVVQLNSFRPAERAATAEVLADIAGQCDGIRVDMAMLQTNDIFARTWGSYAGPAPATEFWPEVIGTLRRTRPDVVLIAEAYWDMEWTLQQQGFDYCYDKRLYDRLAGEDARAVRDHLTAGREFQDRLLRFIENHDEPRAATALPDGRDRAAAVAVATLPGATLWHDGQFEGRRRHLPVFLGRAPEEPVDPRARDFYARLLPLAAEVRRGDWTLLDCHGWPDNPTHREILAWSWPGHVVAVNLSPRPAQARIAVPLPPGRLTDRLDDREYDHDGGETLFVDLPPWGAHILSIGFPRAG